MEYDEFSALMVKAELFMDQWVIGEKLVKEMRNRFPLKLAESSIDSFILVFLKIRTKTQLKTYLTRKKLSAGEIKGLMEAIASDFPNICRYL